MKILKSILKSSSLLLHSPTTKTNKAENFSVKYIFLLQNLCQEKR